MSDFFEEDTVGKGYDPGLMRRFVGYLRPYRRLVILTFLLLVVNILADVVGPPIIQSAIDGPVKARDLDGLTFHVILFLGAVILTGIFEYLYRWVMNIVGQRVLFDLRMHVFGHLQRLPISFFDRNPVGRLTVRVTNDVETLNELFSSGLVEIAANVILLVALVVVMFVLNWKLALLTLAFSPVIILAAFLFRRIARNRYGEMRRRIARVNANLNESVNGMRTIQIFGRERACLDRFSRTNAEYREAAVSTIFAYSLFWPGIEVLTHFSLALLLWYGGTAMLGGSMTFGTFIAFWFCAQKFFQPVRELAEKYNVLQSAMASSERIFKILDTAPARTETPGLPPAPALQGEVAFENVSFSYDGKTPVLEDVSFRVEPGRSLAIVGLTGSGKTTLINLLLRFYDVNRGSIRVDGRDLGTMDVRSLRRQMGLVLQDVFLFAGSVEENIRLGERGISRERVIEAARAVHADRFIGRLPKAYETDVLERGASLSTGERQLLSFARALAFDPRILILDEATSSVDGETEQLIQQGLMRLMKGRTSLIIAHRLSTIQHVDRILVLHRGRVRESGTHAELIRQDGLYRRLYKLQFRGRPAAPAGPEAAGPSPAVEVS